MKILSLFDGISCGMLALLRANLPVTQYFASEIEADSIKISKKNFPDIIQVGSVTELKGDSLPQIDLLIGGSPCQSFSNAGDGTGFDGKSGLFWHYVRLLKETTPKYFLLENVVMKKEWSDIISNALGVQPIKINSSLLSGQNRPRLYWTNIPNVQQPQDKGILLKDILEDNSQVPSNLFLSEKAIDYMSRLRNGKPRWEFHTNPLNGKAACLTANMHKGVPYGVIKEKMRRITPIEAERLQTIPDNYTHGVSATSRYRAIGNCWTIEVISHILKELHNVNDL